MLASDSGVLKQRAWPNGPLQPVRGAEHAALALDVGQHRARGRRPRPRRTPGSARRPPCCSCSVRLMASPIGTARRRRRRAGGSGDDRAARTTCSVTCADRAGRRRAPRSPRRPRSRPPRRAARLPALGVSTPPAMSSASIRVDRVVARLVGQLVGRAVLGLRVGGRVRVRPHDVGVDQRRTDARLARAR